MKHLISVIVVGAAVAGSPSSNAQSKYSTKDVAKPLVYSVVDQMPEFQGDLSKYMVTSLRYPKAAMQAKKEGRVVLRFTVDEKGAVKDVHTVKSVDPALDAEAIRVVKAMPDWKPGRQNGKAVAVYYTLPVMFKLKEKEGNASVKSSEAGVFTYVDQMPEFKGDIKEYLVENLKYPKEAEKKGAEGRVVVRFVIDESGSVKEVETVKSADPLLDAEAERIVKAMPRWEPGKHEGKAVAVYYSLPLTFRLDEASNKKSHSEAKPVK